jgi:hypothetical protein
MTVIKLGRENGAVSTAVFERMIQFMLNKALMM